MSDTQKPTEATSTPHYTRSGDDGTTTLGEAGAVDKGDVRLEAYADCGEANAGIGIALAMSPLPVHVVTALSSIQHDLFDLVTGLTHPSSRQEPAAQATSSHITQEHIDRLERLCDHYGADLPPVDGYVLPGGTVTASLLFQAWSVTLRAERSTWAAVHAYPDTVDPLAPRYLNRLASLLYVLARAANAEHGDTMWYPMASVTTPVEATPTND
ncbi:MAG TPA: cob(I)yrinic acid a,c-diamide adenosyltransferase [Segeticoccus sp.]|nr:cob(I)yrinic acid a,c-diamide adenosyltransferase [Segeticoccus sp.]